MRQYILRRLAAGIALLFAITTVSFFLMIFGAGNVGRQILGVQATNDVVAAKNHVLGLDRPAVVQYAKWIGRAVHGDFGDSWFKGVRVWELMRNRLPVTLTIIFLSLVVASVLALLLGVVAGMRGALSDRVAQSVGLIGFAVPSFLIAFYLITVFALRWHLFRATGYTKPSESITEWLRSVTLPVLSLSFATLASVALQIRGSVRDAQDLDYVRTLRSRGLSRNRTIFKHVLRNAATPALSVLGLQFIGLLGGAIFVEQIFALPGIADLALQSAVGGDVPIVMAVVAVTAMLVVGVNLIVDVVSAWLNPKVRLA